MINNEGQNRFPSGVHEIGQAALEKGTPLGEGVRKVRMTISSKGKGKSGGARVLTYSVNKESDDEIKVTLMSIYDKSRISNVSDEYIAFLVKEMRK